jgi:potassium-transporting ATPase KdpC subunit
MIDHVRRSVVLALIALVLFGLFYGFLGTGVAQLLFRGQADGSVTSKGSYRIGQNWNGYSTTTIKDPQWFHGRPDTDDPLEANGRSGASATGSTSWPSNLGPRSSVLRANVAALVRAWHKVGVNPTADLVTNSGSELDPDITAQDAYAQIPMVSRATGIAPARLRRLIAEHVQGPELGFLGTSYINVLQLNEGLARLR